MPFDCVCCGRSWTRRLRWCTLDSLVWMTASGHWRSCASAVDFTSTIPRLSTASATRRCMFSLSVCHLSTVEDDTGMDIFPVPASSTQNFFQTHTVSPYIWLESLLHPSEAHPHPCIHLGWADKWVSRRLVLPSSHFRWDHWACRWMYHGACNVSVQC